MSRPIAESVSLLNETLGNCKTNLKEKSVTDVDNIKISDVDEKIAEIQAGGGSSGFSCINDVTLTLNNITTLSLDHSYYDAYVDIEGDTRLTGNLKFTVKDEDVYLIVNHPSYYTITPNINLDNSTGVKLNNGVEYTISFSKQYSIQFIFLNKSSDYPYPADYIGYDIV